jgi:hypothetical protein
MYCKRYLKFVVFSLMLTMFFSGAANATLFDRGGGLIYDDALDITWLKDANYAGVKMTWSEAMTWADNLVYGAYGDWRLPRTVDGPFVWGYDGSTTAGYNITSSEMGWMYYVNLHNKGYYATDGTNPQPGWGLINGSPFINLYMDDYWSSTEYSVDPSLAWGFVFSTGNQGPDWKDFYPSGSANVRFAWAVRNGDVGDISSPVPEPTTVLLLGLGLMGLAGVRRKFQN